MDRNHNFFAGSVLVHNCLIIDDPIKNSSEALSSVVQQSLEDWFYSSVKSRLEPNAAIIIMATRWHDMDLIGRVLQREPGQWTVVNYPAIWEETPGEFDVDLGRKPGDALWPARYTADYLRAEQQANPFWFHALYQGHPRPREDAMFNREWFTGKVVASVPKGCRFCRRWDCAATAGGGDWTVGTLLATNQDAWFVADVKRFQKDPTQRDEIIRQTARDDKARYGNVLNSVEEEPGSAGKTASTAFVKMLAGYLARGVRSTGSKELRAQVFADQCRAGTVYLVAGGWHHTWLSELESFPFGKHDDQVDSAAGAFADLLKKAAAPRAASAGKRPGILAAPSGIAGSYHV